MENWQPNCPVLGRSSSSGNQTLWKWAGDLFLLGDRKRTAREGGHGHSWLRATKKCVASLQEIVSRWGGRGNVQCFQDLPVWKKTDRGGGLCQDGLLWKSQGYQSISFRRKRKRKKRTWCSKDFNVAHMSPCSCEQIQTIFLNWNTTSKFWLPTFLPQGEQGRVILWLQHTHARTHTRTHADKAVLAYREVVKLQNSGGWNEKHLLNHSHKDATDLMAVMKLHFSRNMEHAVDFVLQK